MVCTDGVAVLLHCRSLRCYYFLLCMPWIDLLFSSYFVYLLLFHLQEAKGNSFARNKGLTWRLCPCHHVLHGFRPRRALLPLECESMPCVFTQARWEVAAQEAPMAHPVPLWCPVLLVPLAAYSCLGSSSSMSPLPFPLDIVSAPLPSPLCPRTLSVWGSRQPVEQSCFWALTLPIHFACEQHWSRDGPNEWPMSRWRCWHHVVFLRFFTGTSTVQYLY